MIQIIYENEYVVNFLKSNFTKQKNQLFEYKEDTFQFAPSKFFNSLCTLPIGWKSFEEFCKENRTKNEKKYLFVMQFSSFANKVFDFLRKNVEWLNENLTNVGISCVDESLSFFYEEESHISFFVDHHVEVIEDPLSFPSGLFYDDQKNGPFVDRLGFSLFLEFIIQFSCELYSSSFNSSFNSSLIVQKMDFLEGESLDQFSVQEQEEFLAYLSSKK